MAQIDHEWHIWELAEELDVTVHWSRKHKHRQRDNGSWGGTALTGLRVIQLGWQAHGEDPYWVALHELAHIALDHRGLPETPEGTAGEADAWAWALAHSVAPPSTRQVERVRWSLNNYAESRGYHVRVDEVVEDYRRASESDRWQGVSAGG